MSDKVRRVDYSPDEYIAGVGNVLTAAEQGVYWMICSLIMSEGAPIQRNERRLGGLCLMRPAHMKKMIDRLVEIGKIGLTNDGKLAQKRAQSEVEVAAKRIQSARENGMKGGRPAKKDEENQQNGKAAGSFSEKLSPTTNHQYESPNGDSKGKRQSPRKELERVLDAEHAQDVIDHRNRIKKPMTVKAAKLLAGKLAQFDDPNRAADFLIERGWQSIEVAWVQNHFRQERQRSGADRPKSAFEIVSEINRKAEHAASSSVEDGREASRQLSLAHAGDDGST